MEDRSRLFLHTFAKITTEVLESKDGVFYIPGADGSYFTEESGKLTLVLIIHGKEKKVNCNDIIAHDAATIVRALFWESYYG